jgi:class III cytochrome C family protein
MFKKAEKTFAGVLLVVCAIVGIVGYSFSKTSTLPSKVWFDSAGGDVIFDHAYHVTLAECYDCHHNFEPDTDVGDRENNCRACHYYGEARELQSEDPTHLRFIGANCIECHKTVSMEVVCETCHIRQGFAFEESGRVRPALPEAVTFETDNGKVVFNHKIHISEDVGEPCIACHHECKGGKDMKGMSCRKNCRACHYDQAKIIPESKDEYHMRHIGANCSHCHDAENCEGCHQE